MNTAINCGAECLAAKFIWDYFTSEGLASYSLLSIFWLNTYAAFPQNGLKCFSDVKIRGFVVR